MALSGIDKSRFGTGYLSDGEKSGTFVFTSGGIRFDDKQGVGGSTPVQGYDGRWPIFGKTEDSWEAHAAAATSASTSGKGAVKAKQGGPRMICKGTGRCSACPKNERNRPYCQPYGNRAPAECRVVTMVEASERPSSSSSKLKPAPAKINKANNDAIQKGGTLRRDNKSNELELRLWPREAEPMIGSVYKGYQTCGRDTIKEAWDYSEFIGINLILALGGLLLLVRRQRLLAGQHQAMLARRIGRI